MNTSYLPAALLVLSVALQALLPRVRVVIVTVGAALTAIWAVLTQGASTGALLSALPWDVFVILIALGVISELFARSRAFDRLAVQATRVGGASPARVSFLFALVMFFVSGLVNNLTALLLVLPVLLSLLKLSGTTRRHLRWTLGSLIVACNLGGASTPVGDFPAILLLGAGAMEFQRYLSLAYPAALSGLVLLLGGLWLFVRPARDVHDTSLGNRITVEVIEALYRHVRLDLRSLLPTSCVLLSMLVAWLVLPGSGVTPDLVAFAGASLAVVLAFTFRAQAVASSARISGLITRAMDPETVLFLFALFFMVGVVRTTGLFHDIAHALLALDVGGVPKLLSFFVLAGLLTGLFSAGPSMAALLEVASELARTLPKDAVYVGLAMSVCAGSSLFLTAATSGPLAQAMVERALLRDHDGNPLTFGFAEFLPVGLLSFGLILLVAMATGAILSGFAS